MRKHIETRFRPRSNPAESADPGRRRWPDQGARDLLVLAGHVVLVTGLVLLVMVFGGKEDAPRGQARLVVESGLQAPTLVDVRFRLTTGEIDGSLARAVAPGEAATFLVRAERPLCLRLIGTEDGRVTALSLGSLGDGSATSIRLDRAAVHATARGPCDRDLEEHRIRPRLGRYFLPGRPGEVRREPILFR